MSLIRARYRAVNTIMNLPSGGGYVGLLDLYPNAAAAYSLRLLRKDYSGGLVRARAWDGSANQGEADVMAYRVSATEYVLDLNSTLENLDATAISRGLTTSDTLADLVSTGVNDYDGLTSAWYDQSLSNDATQTTAAKQPKIVSAGSLVTEGTSAKPAIDFDGVNDALNAIGANLVTGNSAYSVFTVGLSNTTVSSDYYWGINATQNGSGAGTTAAFTPEFAIRVIGNAVFSNSASGSQELLSLLYDGTTIQNHSLHINGVNSVVGSSANGSSPMNIANGDFRIGGWGASPGFLDGNLQEIIVYPSNQSANRASFETNINTFYSIY